MNIGITGHRHLENYTAWPWVEEAMGRELDALPPPLVAVTSLAVGADQLLASLVVERGGQIEAILPFRDYQRTFEPEELASYQGLLAIARLETLAVPGSDEDAYLAAGESVARRSDLLFAVWDGSPARGKGGTADVVAYARRRRMPWVHLNPVSQQVVRYGYPLLGWTEMG